MNPCNQSICSHNQLLTGRDIKQCGIITNTQRHTGLTGEVGEIVGDQVKLAGLMLEVRQVKSSLCSLRAAALNSLGCSAADKPNPRRACWQ